MTTLAGQTILVVGGSSGIGFGVAKLSLLSNASRVIIASSQRARVDNAIERLVSEVGKDVKERVRGEVVDVKNTADVRGLMGRVGEIDHLVWTAGDQMLQIRQFPNVDLEECKSLFDTRFWSPIEAAKVGKFRSGGSIVFTSGQVSKRPTKGFSLGAGMAGSIDSLVRGLAVDLAPIRVNNVSPGIVATELLDSFMDKKTQAAFFGKLVNDLLVKHVGGPDEVAEAYIFLMK